MKGIIRKILASLDNTTEGFSARKLSALAAVIIAIELSIVFGSEEKAVELTAVWLLFALLCLSVITFEQVIKFKNGNQSREV